MTSGSTPCARAISTPPCDASPTSNRVVCPRWASARAILSSDSWAPPGSSLATTRVICTTHTLGASQHEHTAAPAGDRPAGCRAADATAGRGRLGRTRRGAWYALTRHSSPRPTTARPKIVDRALDAILLCCDSPARLRPGWGPSWLAIVSRLGLVTAREHERRVARRPRQTSFQEPIVAGTADQHLAAA